MLHGSRRDMTPPRLSLDDPHTPEQFAQWLQVSTQWVRDRITVIPGVIRESREVVRIIPRVYIEARTRTKRKDL